MKPYKIIRSNSPINKKTIFINKLTSPKVPLWFVKKVHTPEKREIA